MHLDHRDSRGVGPHTWEEFLELDEDDPRELVDGELLELEVPDPIHEHIVARLVTALRNWADANDEDALVVASGYKVRIDVKKGFMPDVQLYRSDNLPRRDRDHEGLWEGHPDVAVEVISPKSSRSRDRVLKLAGYAKIGVPEYWIVDSQHETIERFVLGADGRYVVAQTAQGDVDFAPPTIEGLSIPLVKMWAQFRDPKPRP